MRRFLSRLAPGLLLAGLLAAGLLTAVPGQFGIAPAHAQTNGNGDETPNLILDRWDAEAAAIEKMLDEGEADSGEIEGMRATLDAQRAAVPGLIAKAEAEIAPLRQQLEALGPAPDDPASEADQVAAERKRLTERIGAAEARLKRPAQADARAKALQMRLAELRRQRFTRELLTRNPGIFDEGSFGRAIASIAGVGNSIAAETAERVAAATLDLALLIRVVLLPLALTGAALLLLPKVKRAVLRRLMRRARAEVEATKARTPSALSGFSMTMVRLLVPAAALVMMAFAIWNSQLLGPQGGILLAGVTRALMAVVAAYALGGAFYSPHHPDFRLSQLPAKDAMAASRWLIALAAVVGLDDLLVLQGDSLGLSVEALAYINAALLLCGAIALWGYSGYLVLPAQEAPPPRAEDELEPASDEQGREFWIGPALFSAARVAARSAAMAAPALAVMGYYAASRFAFYPLVLSGAVIGICVLLFWRVRGAVDRIADTGETHSTPSRVLLIPVLVAFLLTCLAAPVLALIWGADLADLASAWRAISGGFTVGDVKIAPMAFFGFLLVFSVGYVLTRMVQGVLSRSVLPATGLDTGGRAAIRAGVGYIGITLSALVAISATRLDLSNLAIVAGALSVGIGFGLQNIVNNFVSGIILLIERPIKAGDWVELGSGTGYVKRINVRSTEIETFDRSSLIVPNSELISGPVTNYTHGNLNGRLIVPIGVAYGTDPRKVEEILTEIATSHSMLLRRPTPYVLFRRFGADALEFEIRGVLRDVNWIMNVTSDINYEIARRFAEAGIEIPFAQRDLHLRNAGELGRSIADALKGVMDEQAQPAEEAQPKRKRSRPSSAAGFDADGDS